MRITLQVIAGPHQGLVFSFDRHDTFLVGRSKHAHFQLPMKDRYFSRIHFMMEVNPPCCRLVDVGSHNGTYVNDQRVLAIDLNHGDKIRAGHTVLQLHVVPDPTEAIPTAMPIVGEAKSQLPEVPGYHVVGQIGNGILGTVYLAQGAEGRQFAIKVIRPQMQVTPEQAANFLRAARPLLSLNDPYIIKLHDLGLLANGFYFVYDYVQARNTLEIVKRRGPLTTVKAVRWASQTLQAMERAHDLGLVHYDIKPSNLLIVTENGKEQVKISDFGLARIYHASPFSGLSLTKDQLGAATHQPPEFLLNHQEALPSGDQYATAATLYYLLTGMSSLDMPKELHRQFSTVLRQQLIPIQERRPDLPTPLANAIHKGLSRSPSQRYRSVSLFRNALILAIKGDSAP